MFGPFAHVSRWLPFTVEIYSNHPMCIKDLHQSLKPTKQTNLVLQTLYSVLNNRRQAKSIHIVLQNVEFLFLIMPDLTVSNEIS
jgi:hypothetical protein